MKQLFIFLCFFMPCSCLIAQEAKLVVGCKKQNAAGNPVVQLKFMFPSAVISPCPVNVFRKRMPDGNWEKITKMPLSKTPVISIAQLSSAQQAGDDAYKAYEGFMNHKPAASPKDENNYLAAAGLMIVTDNAFAFYAGCYFEDSSAQNGVTYQYRITNAAQGDKELAVAAPFTATTDYLPVVTALTAKQKKQYVYLNWNKQQLFYGYKLYRKTGLSAKPVAVSEDPILLGKMSGETVKDNAASYKYLDTAGIPGSKIYYQVAGVDVLNNESVLSKEFEVEIRDMVPPHPANNLKAEKKDKNAVLNWKPVPDKDCNGYNIYRNSTLDTVYKKINPALIPVSTVTYTDNQPAEGAVYGYYIESVDAAGNTAKSQAARVFFPDQTAPAKPAGLKAIAKPGLIQITWDRNTEPDFKGYLIYRANTRDKEYFNQLNRVPLLSNAFTDTLPGVAKNEFVYYVCAVDKAFNKSINSDTIIAMLPDTLAPHAPWLADLKDNKEAGIDLKWQKPFDSDVEGYNVFRSEDTGSNRRYNKINQAPLAGLVFTDKNTRSNVTYTYYVTAVDKAGNVSALSNKRTIYKETDTAELKTAENVRAAYITADSAVRISWTGNSVNIHGYIVYRKESGEESFLPVSALVKLTTFADRNIEPGRSYEYMIRSYYEGFEMYKNSASVSIMTSPNR